jgi:hypothetical protein
MENPSFNGRSDPAARTGCEVGAKVPDILFSRRASDQPSSPRAAPGALSAPLGVVSGHSPNSTQQGELPRNGVACNRPTAGNTITRALNCWQ